MTKVATNAATVRVRLAALLHSYTGSVKEIEVPGGTILEVMAALDERFPGIAFRVIDEQGHIRPHMNVFVGEDLERNESAPIPPGSEVYVVGALSGG